MISKPASHSWSTVDVCEKCSVRIWLGSNNKWLWHHDSFAEFYCNEMVYVYWYSTEVPSCHEIKMQAALS